MNLSARIRKMTVALPTENVSNGKMLDGDKEQTRAYQLVAFKAGKFHTPVTVRCWMGRSSSASTVYASVWVDGKGIWCGGHGKAGGYGYDKHSSAIGAAFRSAGVKMSERIDGVGESAVEDAIYAVGRALGYPRNRMTIVRL